MELPCVALMSGARRWAEVCKIPNANIHDLCLPADAWRRSRAFGDSDSWGGIKSVCCRPFRPHLHAWPRLSNAVESWLVSALSSKYTPSLFECALASWQGALSDVGRAPLGCWRPSALPRCSSPLFVPIAAKRGLRPTTILSLEIMLFEP